VADTDHAEGLWGFVRRDDVEAVVVEIAVEAVRDLIGRQGDKVERPRDGVVDVDLLSLPADEEEVAAAAFPDLPPGGGVIAGGDAGEEEIGAADGAGEVRVGAARRRGCRLLRGRKRSPGEAAGGARGSGGGRRERSGWR